MDFKNIKIQKENKLAFVTIDRQEVRNALNADTLEEIAYSVQHLEEDSSVGCIVFTGAGEKSFASGADIKQLSKKNALDALTKTGMQQVYDSIESCAKPTIAMINGFALGGGCELAMACDIRIASSNAKIGLPELNLSIIPGAGGTQRLARIVGKGKALEMILTGKIIMAEEALKCGLVSEVVEINELKSKTKEYAAQILSKGPLSVQLAKLTVNMGTETDIKTGLMIEKLSQAILFNSDDKNEGTSAFLEKRQPNFMGK